jgi:uncharacterized glyoxalase superfamily protein PhnB
LTNGKRAAEKNKMKKDKISRNKVFRIVPNIYSDNMKESKKFYIQFLQSDLVMDMQWILTFASKTNPSAQISILKNETKHKIDNQNTFLSIEVSNVDELYHRAKEHNYEIPYELTDEDWGVRRFFVKDPNGATLNIVMHK